MHRPRDKHGRFLTRIHVFCASQVGTGDQV
jgi:hypothetical protein